MVLCMFFSCCLDWRQSQCWSNFRLCLYENGYVHFWFIINKQILLLKYICQSLLINTSTNQRLGECVWCRHFNLYTFNEWFLWLTFNLCLLLKPTFLIDNRAFTDGYYHSVYFMPELWIVDSLSDSASFRRLEFRAKYFHINPAQKYKQTFVVMCSFIVSVNKLCATDLSISPDE